MTRYLTFDVFTDTRFGGNPLAVFPEAKGLPEADLQRIAREFNYSETTFVYPPSDPAHTARVRIFTPTQEVPFAGHPTIGTSIALARAGYGPEMVLELGIGPISVQATKAEAAFTAAQRLETLAQVDPELVARCLSLDPGQIVGAPVQASLGLPFVLAELADRAALRACRPAIDAFHIGAERHPTKLDFAVYAWCRHEGGIAARMFAPLDDIPEDPATGSAAATLARHLGPGRYEIAQGEDMGRPSRITAVATEDAVTISGSAVAVMEGRLL